MPSSQKNDVHVRHCQNKPSMVLAFTLRCGDVSVVPQSGEFVSWTIFIPDRRPEIMVGWCKASVYEVNRSTVITR